MVDQLATALIIAGVVIGGWCLLQAGRDRTVDGYQLVAATLAELAVLAQVVIAVVRLASGERPSEMATFLGYLAAVLLVLPAGAALALIERTRWGTMLLGVAGLVLAVLVVRLQQVWHG